MATSKKKSSSRSKKSSQDSVQNSPAESATNTPQEAIARETADPNFTAARRDRSDALSDAKETRMNTGSSAGPGFGKADRQAPKLVRDLMTVDVAVCNPQTELYYVARTMEERDVGAVPVVESTDSMKPIGIVTDRDIVVRALAKNQEALRMRAGDVMSVDLLTIDVEMPLQECVNQMEQRQVRRAIVLDHTGRCTGIIAQADIARHLAEHESAELLREVSEPNPQQSSEHYH
jgi:CBS domain-containing protein